MLVAPARVDEERTSLDPVRRIGITASRKVGGAVVRNRIKRGVRDWFRRSREQLPDSVDVVVIARPAAAALSGRQLSARLSQLAASIDRPRHA